MYKRQGKVSFLRTFQRKSNTIELEAECFYPFIAKILAPLEDGKYLISTEFNSELAFSKKQTGISFERTQKSESIYWHQDMFFSHTGIQDYEYLYFLVLKNVDISPHTLNLGLTPKEALDQKELTFAFEVEDSQVESVVSLQGKSGAGYYVDQTFQTKEKKVLVHSRSGFYFMPFTSERDKIIVRIKKDNGAEIFQSA